MSNYLVDGANLTSVADAIRAKGGTSGQLQFPAGFVSAVEAIETGAQTAPYVVLTGIITPASDSTSIGIPASGITQLVLAEGHVENHENYLTSDYENMGLGFYCPYGKAFIPTTYGVNNGVFFVYMSNSNHRSYYSARVTASFSNGLFTISNSRGVVFRAGIPVRYIVVGV